MSGSGVVRELNRTQIAEAGHKNALAAIQNEQLTRERVARLEHARQASDPLLADVAAVIGRSFFGRLRWLLIGR